MLDKIQEIELRRKRLKNKVKNNMVAKELQRKRYSQKILQKKDKSYIKNRKRFFEEAQEE